MFYIHLPTVFAFSTMLTTSLGALLIWLWRRDRSQPALATWGVGRLLTTASLPLLAARGMIPDWLSINLANALICLSYGLTWRGARQFEEQPAYPSVVLAGPVVWLLACEIPAFYASLQYRITLIGLILGAYNAVAALEFHRGQMRSPLPSRPIVTVILTMVAILYAACGPMSVFFPFRQTSTGLPTSIWFGFIVSLGVGLMAGTSILLVALTKERAELRSITALSDARDLAAEASEQKTRFLARMSHELRTPLNGMLGLAQLLANDPEQGERQRGQAATLEQAGRHLLAILNEVLDLSRIESGKLTLAPAPISLVSFLQDTLAIVRGEAISASILLDLETAPDLPQTVLADAMRLRQILLNLLNNALKFTPPHGRVVLRVTPSAGEHIRFAVTDTGRGVPAALRPRLFQDYTQAEETDVSFGTGLGLAISARLAIAMGGSLSHTDGSEGIGSCFTLMVRLPEAAPCESSPSPQPPSPSRRLRILIVDDVALNRMAARALLLHAGHEVAEVADGRSALAAIAQGPLPDVVLMDQSMPVMDGQSVARQIRAMAGEAGQVPILALTASGMPQDIDASVAAGMDGHVTKPIELQPLLIAIDNALKRAALRRHDAGASIAASPGVAGD